MSISATINGNIGILPFLTLFMIGVIEKSDPDILNMPETTQGILSSWASLIFLGTMTVLEILSKCIPAVDSAVDSIMTFLLPIFSVLATMGTFGLYQGDESDSSYEDSEGNRNLEDQDRSIEDVESNFIMVFQFVLIITGLILAFSMHFFKMLLRLFGQVWLTGCLTILEMIFCIGSITMAIYVQEIAVFIACGMLVACLYTWYSVWRNRQKKEDTLLQYQRDEDHNPPQNQLHPKQPEEHQMETQFNKLHEKEQKQTDTVESSQQEGCSESPKEPMETKFVAIAYL